MPLGVKAAGSYADKGFRYICLPALIQGNMRYVIKIDINRIMCFEACSIPVSKQCSPTTLLNAAWR
jgi:hypothetical protein